MREREKDRGSSSLTNIRGRANRSTPVLVYYLFHRGRMDYSPRTIPPNNLTTSPRFGASRNPRHGQHSLYSLCFHLAILQPDEATFLLLLSTNLPRVPLLFSSLPPYPSVHSTSHIVRCFLSRSSTRRDLKSRKRPFVRSFSVFSS